MALTIKDAEGTELVPGDSIVWASGRYGIRRGRVRQLVADIQSEGRVRVFVQVKSGGWYRNAGTVRPGKIMKMSA